MGLVLTFVENLHVFNHFRPCCMRLLIVLNNSAIVNVSVDDAIWWRLFLHVYRAGSCNPVVSYEMEGNEISSTAGSQTVHILVSSGPLAYSMHF